ncbi:hypothetical protein NDU88_002427 [Pleurodeles waltl]|uniref:Uncharacterized protein n=1 Tax=Pleurodeles waltl TaxID=8319 RepID=A0AAV7VZB7_PLEWA|nr:hypothetical protein NDU88_002427 [Pleurodeles waltl]
MSRHRMPDANLVWSMLWEPNSALLIQVMRQEPEQKLPHIHLSCNAMQRKADRNDRRVAGRTHRSMSSSGSDCDRGRD